MANNSPTIVAASLSDDQLKKSIDSLVTHVDEAMKKMVQSTNKAVGEMEAKLKSLGNLKIDSGGAADGGSSKRTSSLKQEEQQVKSVTTSYDGLAKAKQTAIGSRGGSALRKDIDEAANSYSGLIQQIERTQAKFDISPIQNLRMRQHELEAGMQTAANEAAKAKKDVDELNAAISNYRKTLETLPKNQQGFANRQAIQKEINDLITLRDASVSEQQKWTNAGRVLAAQYESVKGEIKQIGQALIDSEKTEKQVTSELDKQLQKIKEINSSKSAKAAYESISSMPTNTIDQVETKLQALQALKEKVASTPLLSKSSQSQLTQAITDTKSRIEQLESSVRGTNQSKKSLDELNAAVAQTIRREEERRNAILQTGIAAQESFAKIRQSAQIQLADNTDKPIMGVKELTEAIRNMERAYWGMDAVNRESPLGQSLQRDIENAQKLRTAIEAYNKTLLGIPVIQDKSGVDKTLGSYTELSNILKTLSDEYRHLGREERNAAKGNDLADKIQRLGRETQKIQQQMNRPINLDTALKGSEKTIDDITYKIRRLQSYKVGIDLTNPNAANEIKQVDEAIVRLQKDMDKYLGKSKDIIANNNALGRSWNYMKNRLAFYVTVGAGTQFIKNLIEVRSQYEMNEKALGILLDSASRGTRIFNELSQMSLVSPYTLIELSSAAKQLTAYDIAAKDVVDTTRRLADMASAVGVPVERLTYALGQIKAYGYLNSRDARMFANAGIPLVKQLADYYSELEGKMVSTADVYDRMKKKAIDYADVMKVVTKMTDEGGKFFDFQAKMADTLKVRLANLTLAWNNMLNELGKSNQGTLTTGIKSLTVIFRHWREIYRILSTLIVALGAYKVATILAGMTTKSAIGSSAVASWLSLARGVKSAKDAVALFSLTLKSIPFTGWVTAIATLASYFYLFNNSTDGLKQKLEDIATAFDGVRKEITDLYADALKSDNIGSQLTKLRDMLELAQTEMGVTIPINLEEVDERNIKDKLREAKRFIDDYINFSQTFSEAAAGTKFNELMNEFGASARSTYTSITESINTVVVALEKLSRTFPMTDKEKNALDELLKGQKEDESRIEYLQRLVRLYEELGLVGKKVTTPSISFFSSSKNNMDELTEQQNMQLDRLGVKNRQVFENMLKDVQNYYSSSAIAQYQFEQQVERVAKKIDINNIPVEQRTVKLSAAINEEASQNNWNQFEKEFARQIANKKFGTNIVISEESKGVAETELQEWQKRQQAWMDKNGINVKLNFQTNDTEVSYASRMLQAAKDAKEEVEVQQRKLAVGTGSQDAVDAAKKAYENARILAKEAGADLEQLDKKANAAAKKAAKAAETELSKALKDELSTIEKVRSIYRELTKEGASHADAIKSATEGWEETVNAINRVLTKNGLKGLNLNDFVGVENPREILKTLQAQLDEMVKRGAKPAEIKVLQEKIKTIKVDAEKYDLTKITKGLNNELDRLKEEYELAVSLDADPELGNMFADWMGIDVNDLPRTAQEYANRYTDILNNKLKKYNANIDLPNLLNITDDYLRELQNRVGTGGVTQKYVDDITKGVKAVREVFRKEKEDTSRDWNALIEKYGGLQAKLLKIYKDNVQQQESIVREFGTNDEQTKALDLISKIKISQDHAEVARLQKELALVMNDVTSRNPVALKTYQATQKEQSSLTSKAMWDDFKDSDLYSMTFTDMANNSTQAIQLIIDKLNELKDKVKEDPASMKALIKSLEDAEKELNARDPFAGIVNSIKNWSAASKEAKVAQEELRDAEKAVANAQSELDDAEDGTPEEQALAQKNLTDAIQRRGNAEVKVVQAENKVKKSQEQLNTSLTGLSNTLNEIGGLFGTVAKLFAAAGDDDTAEAINAISEGFSTMTTVIMGVVAAMMLLEATNPWLLAISAALGVIVGLVSFLSGNRNKGITKKVEESERAVKRLELAYVDLQQAVDKAYGTAVIGAKQATLANKELQLAEIQRQIQLEKSRSSKNRDEDKIIDLQKQYKELFYEIRNGYTEIVDDLMGTDVGSFAENLVSSMIDAFKQGEDYMQVFSDKFDEMIDNMIMKSIVSRVVSQYLDAIWEDVDKHINDRTEKEREDAAKAQNEAVRRASLSDDEVRMELVKQRGDIWSMSKITQKDIDDYRKAALAEEKSMQARLDAASAFTGSDVDYVMQRVTEVMPELGQKLKDILGEYYKYGESSETQLSALQQGISQISEQTAGALEAYANSISQQAYLRNDLLVQIRDTIMSFDMDVQLGVFSQMLLQLQNNYIVMQSMQSIMEGWTTPSGQGIRVELIS